MPAGKKVCPDCGGKKDYRAKRCYACRIKYDHPRLNTGKGWQQHSTGYVTSCKNGKWVYQHRVTMEEHLGRKLHADEHVHHVDGDKSNNNIDNLELISASDHRRMHIASRVYKMSKMGHKARWGEKNVSFV